LKKKSLTIFGAVITALLSTLCCLPAFLFIFFGISSGILTYFTSLEYLRIPMAILTVLLFILAIRQSNKNISCEKDRKRKILQYTFSIGFFFLLIFLLFYPEIIPYFMD
jgi:mercuric ion transport protein